MLNEIGDEKNIKSYIDKAKNKNDPFRLMGFGHRVYKNYDPRANVLRKYCHNLLKEVDNFNVPLFKLANKLEEIALNDDYFVKKKLYPNVDFWGFQNPCSQLFLLLLERLGGLLNGKK